MGDLNVCSGALRQREGNRVGGEKQEDQTIQTGKAMIRKVKTGEITRGKEERRGKIRLHVINRNHWLPYDTH